MRPEMYRRALVEERAGYLASGQPSRVISVDEELARIGYVVDSATGELVEIDKVTRSVKRQPPKEKAVQPLPEKAVED